MVFNDTQSNIWVCFADLLSKRDNQIYANMTDNRTLSDATTLYSQIIWNASEAKWAGETYCQALTHTYLQGHHKTDFLDDSIHLDDSIKI